MIKIIIIIGLVAMLIFSIVRKLNLFGQVRNTQRISAPTHIIEINAPLSIYQSLVKKTLVTVVIGIGLLLATIILASKFKIALIMLPISLYLIAQFFVLNNHLKIARDLRMFYDIHKNEIEVNIKDSKTFKINLLSDIIKIKEIKSVQKNNGILFGYYQLTISSGQVVYIPYLLRENPYTKPFFDKLEIFDREIETKLFPVI